MPVIEGELELEPHQMPATQKPTPAPVPRVAPATSTPLPCTLAGIPDPEADDALVEARALDAALGVDLASTDATVNALAVELELPPNASRAKIENVVTDLLAAGKDTNRIDELRAAVERARLLREAKRKTEARVQAVLNPAYSRASREAAERVYLPAERQMAQDIVVFLAAVRRYESTITKLRDNRVSGGISRRIPNEIPMGIVESRPMILELIRAGHLDRDAVRLAFPELRI